MKETKKVNKIKNKSNKIKSEVKPIDKDGYPIKRWEICFKCKKEFWLTFVSLKQTYAQRNFWFYWTEKEEDQQKFICSPCLRKIYLEDKEFYLSNIKDIRKKRMISSYYCSSSI